MVSVSGASGSGKSTLMNIIGLLDTPKSGSYLLEDREVSQMSDDQRSIVRNERIGFVFQSFNLLPRLSVLANVGIPLVYRGARESEIRERAVHALDLVGMADFQQYLPSEMSGGQQQRIAIARAIVGEPAIVLADEPTGALDPATSDSIMDLFHLLNKNEMTTLIIITHDPEVALQCSRQTRIEEGRLYEETPKVGDEEHAFAAISSN